MTSQTRTKATDPNSMFIWLPVVEAAGIPSPRTEMVDVGPGPLTGILDGNPLPHPEPIIQAAERIGYPLFLRTDLASGKHSWRETCFVTQPERLLNHVYAVVEFNEMAGVIGLNYTGLALREYVELDSPFKAFQEMPVARERRYFAEEGKVLCHHPYWIEDAIAAYGAHRPMLPPDWRQRLADLNHEGDEVGQLTEWAEAVSASRELEGVWSIDFAHTRDGRWLLIDMALGAMSWHPACEATT